MALEIADVLESGHVEHVYSAIIGSSYDFTIWEFNGDVYGSGVVLLYGMNTDENDADFAIFLRPVMGMFERVSIIALEFDYFIVFIVFVLLWRVISKGPAWESLF